MAITTEKIILDIRSQLDKAKRDIKDLKSGVSGVNKEVNKTTQLFKKAAGALAAFASIGILVNAVKTAIELNIEFEKSITNVMTLLDKSTKVKFGDFISRGAIETMSKFGLEVSDVNKALFDTISAGIKAGNSIKFLDEAAKLAVGGVTTLSTAVDGMTSIMNAYKLSINDANKVASAFFTAQKFGKTTVEELAQSIGMVAPVAKMAGVSFQEVLTALALLTKQGIQTDIATTALRATLVALTSPTRASATEFKKLGIETGMTAIKEVGLAETLLKVAKATKIHKDKMTELIPNVRALVGVAALGEEALIEYDEILKAVNTDTGEGSSLAEAFEEQMSTLAKQIDITKTAFKGYQLTLNSSEAKEGYKSALEFIRKIIGLSSELVDKKWFEKLASHALTFGWSTSKAFWKAFSNLDSFDNELEGLLERMKGLEAFGKKEISLPWITGEVLTPEEEEDEEEEIKKLDKRQKELVKRREAYAKEGFSKELKTHKKITDKKADYELASVEKLAEDRIAIEKATGEIITELNQETADDETAIKRAKFEGDLVMGAWAADQLSGLLAEGAEKSKDTAIIKAVIDTISIGIKSYLAALEMGLPGLVAAPLAAAQGLAFGYAQVKKIEGMTFVEGGFTGRSKIPFVDSKGKRIAGLVHEDEFVFDKQKTLALRPFFEDIHHERIDIKGLAALTRRGTIMPIINNNLNTDILEREVQKIYKKMSEEKDNSSEAVFDGGIIRKRGTVTTIIK